MASYEVAEAFIEVMNAVGVESVFYNPGYDVIPILGVIARYKQLGKPAPTSILCLDESVAMAAAHGSYMVSGRPQVVLVHSELGTQQIGGALHQAQWGRAPIIICAGLKEPAERETWQKKPFDQGSIVRNCVKWDHQITKNENFAGVLQKAFQIAAADPAGPVYVWFLRELLFTKVEIPPQAVEVRNIMASNAAIDTTVLNRIAEMLLGAESPLIMTGYSGRNPRTVSSLVEMAETLGARVITSPVRMNFPSDHPLCAYIEPNDGIQVVNPYLKSTDVLLLIDYDLPYVPPVDQPGPQTRIIHIDIDHTKQGLPLWNRKAEIIIQADSGKAISVLNNILRERITPQKQAQIRNHSQILKAEHQTLRAEWQQLAVKASAQKPISSEWVCYCLNKVIDEETIIVNQTIGPAGAVARQIPRTRPGTTLACAGGSIGWAIGAALGVKIAAPDKTVISLMGDGAFVFGCPTATLWPAKFYKAAFLSIIFNNQEYGAIKMAFKMACPEGQKNAEIVPSPDYALTAQACGAYGRLVADPADVLPTLREALEQVRSGCPAVLDIRIG